MAIRRVRRTDYLRSLVDAVCAVSYSEHKAGSMCEDDAFHKLSRISDELTELIVAECEKQIEWNTIPDKED